MLLTIHNLPANTRYCDIKKLILTSCGLTEVLLDHLVNEGDYKKVTVGVAEEEDAAILVRKINGLYVEGAQLYVEDIRQKKKSTEQPYRPMSNSNKDYDQRENPVEQPGPGLQGMFAQQNLPMQMNMLHNMAQFNPQLMVQDAMMMMNRQMMGMGMYYMEQMAATAQLPLQYNFNPNQNLSGPMSDNSAINQNNRDKNFKPNREDNESDKVSKSYRGYNRSSEDNEQSRECMRVSSKPSRWGSDNENLAHKRTKQTSRWNTEETSPSRGRSRSPHPQYRDDAAFDNRFRNDQQRFGDDFDQRSVSNVSNVPETERYGGRRNESYDSKYSSRNVQEHDIGHDKPMDHRSYRPEQSLQSWEYGNTSSQKDRPQTSQEYYEPRETRKRPNPDSMTDNSSRQTWSESLRISIENKSQSFANREQNRFTSMEQGPPQKFSRNTENMRSNIDAPPRRNPSPRGNPTVSGNLANNKYKFVRDPSATENLRRNPSPKGNPTVSGYQANSKYKFVRDPSASENRDMRYPPTNVNRPSVRFPPATGNPPRMNCPQASGNPPPKRFPSGGGNPTSMRYPPGNGNPSTVRHPLINKNPPSKKIAQNDEMNLKRTIQKDDTWRRQAAAQIAKEIISTRTENMDDETTLNLLWNLKKAVFARIDLLLKNEIGVVIKNVIEKYRKRFPVDDDKTFLTAVIENMKKEAAETPQRAEGVKVNHGESAQQAKKLVPDKKVAANINKEPKKEIPKPPLAESGKLPNYPNADKAGYKVNKQQQKLEFENEDYYKCDPLISQALEKELDQLCAIFKNELMKPADKSEVTICQRLTVQPLVQFRKAAKINLVRRILDVKTNLAIRVMPEGKIPSPSDMSYFLRQYGAVSLKKCDKKKKNSRPFFLATCETYEAYDKLCSLGHVKWDDRTSLFFKPFQVAGPKQKNNNKMKQKKNTNTFNIDFSEDPKFDDDNFMNVKEEAELFYIDIPDVTRNMKKGGKISS
ncbi:unnamed protein product [Diatraea saccharalis]|uniref:RRM domain-containing protein n=1 Tax=Diatraea saccharalis TaxID=40085 RepID=A0A9N9R5T1_9NEOP|nr:unnamed protein product [Diatraea saccharalis]